MLQVQSSLPEPALRPFIRAYVQREAQLGVHELVEPVIARLGVMIEFEFAGSYEVRNYGTETVEDPNAISIIGPQSWRRSRLIIRGNIESLVVMFQPLGFSALFGVSTEPLSEGGTEGHSVLGQPVSRLHEQMGNLDGFHERVHVLNRFFSHQADQMRRHDPVLAALVRLARPGKKVRVDDLARQAGISCRQLERKSLAYAGVTPKTVAKITRFAHALHLHSTKPLTWTEIAQDAGYHDHMHLIRDFRVFAGCSPTTALKQVDEDDLIHYARDRA